MKTCDVCSGKDNVKPTKVGLLVCSECAKPMRECHDVFGGKVVGMKKEKNKEKHNDTRQNKDL